MKACYLLSCEQEAGDRILVRNPVLFALINDEIRKRLQKEVLRAKNNKFFKVFLGKSRASETLEPFP